MNIKLEQGQDNGDINSSVLRGEIIRLKKELEISYEDMESKSLNEDDQKLVSFSNQPKMIQLNNFRQKLLERLNGDKK